MAKTYQLELNIEKYCWEHTATYFSDEEWETAAAKHDPYDPTICYFNGNYIKDVEALLTSMNEKLASNKDKYLVCKECGKVFLLTNREASWFKEQDLQPPKRCLDCRKKNKKSNKDSR